VQVTRGAVIFVQPISWEPILKQCFRTISIRRWNLHKKYDSIYFSSFSREHNKAATVGSGVLVLCAQRLAPYQKMSFPIESVPKGLCEAHETEQDDNENEHSNRYTHSDEDSAKEHSQRGPSCLKNNSERNHSRNYTWSRGREKPRKGNTVNWTHFSSDENMSKTTRRLLPQINSVTNMSTPK
jgi:hypothetical protein